MDRDYETRTQYKYTVRLLCLDLDIMADEQVWAENALYAMSIAEKQVWIHDGHCHSEAQSWEEGWIVIDRHV